VDPPKQLFYDSDITNETFHASDQGSLPNRLESSIEMMRRSMI
jgi:hypothetical protein